MTTPMSPERFMELAAAYGADRSRWPAAEQPAAQALWQGGAASSRAALAQVLADAALLDGLLARQQVAAPSPDLQDRIEATAPQVRAGTARGSSRPASGAPWWLPVLGMAGVGAAGAAAGAFAMSFGLAVVQAPAAEVWSNSGNAFGVAGQQWGEE